MYTQQDLIRDVSNHIPFDSEEAQHHQTLLAFLQNDNNPFDRKNSHGHVTGSAWLLSPDHQSVLLTHHKFLDKWLQFGGHADGEANIKNVAFRETQEESGIMEVDFVQPDIFDVDVHAIPANPKKGEGEHLHYDIRYLLRAAHMDFKISDESNDLKWISLQGIRTMDFPTTMTRMIEKWENFLTA